jgi:hypothetical protein
LYVYTITKSCEIHFQVQLDDIKLCGALRPWICFVCPELQTIAVVAVEEGVVQLGSTKKVWDLDSGAPS